MEHSTEASIPKILLDVSEYERLRHIEKKYIEEQKTKNNQTGAGNFLESVIVAPPNPTDIVSEEPLRPEIVEPEPIPNKNVLIPFNVSIVKDDENSIFDEKQLLATIPKIHLKKASILLNEFSKRGNELTWNSQGTIFVDQTSVANSNIFVLFPLLFKRFQKSFSSISGYDDFVQKIFDMGLSDLIFSSKKNLTTPSVKDDQSKLEADDVPWWYLGP